MRPCRFLRNKTIAASLGDDELFAFAAALSDTPWTCLKTTLPWGPDDSPACPEGCVVGRSCFEDMGAVSRRSPAGSTRRG